MMDITNIKTSQQTKLWRIAALVTLCCFVFTTVLGDIFVEAAVKTVGNTVETPQWGVSTITKSAIELPPSLGTIKDSFLLPQQIPTIIHIQDAHCNYSAQRKIAEIIDYFHEKYGLNTVNLEGGEGKYDVSPFTDIKDSAVREKVSDYFVKEGIVNGAEYYAINNPDKVKLWGVEDTELYLENLNVYRDFLKHKDEVDVRLKEIEDIFSGLKREIYSKELLEFDERYNKYKETSLKFEEYIAYLDIKALEKSISLKDFSNISILIRMLNAEQNITFERANEEREILIDELRRKLSKNSLEKLVAKTVEFKKETVQAKEFYAFLIHESKAVNINLERFPELQRYVEYIDLYESMNKSVLMDEIGRLEDAIKESLYENDRQRELGRLSKNLVLTKNLFNITLTKEDYNYYKENEKAFDTLCPSLNQYRRAFSQFYEYSSKRDQAFLKRIKRTPNPDTRTPNPEPRTTILITGGFHTENLSELFKKNNISYITIMPNFKNSEGYECQYFNLLSGKTIETLKVLVSEVSNLALYTDFCENVAKVYSPEEREAKELWRDLAQAVFEEKKDITIHNIQYSFHDCHSEDGEARSPRKRGRSYKPIEGLQIDDKQVYAKTIESEDLPDEESGDTDEQDLSSNDGNGQHKSGVFMRFFSLPMFFNLNNGGKYGDSNSDCYKYPKKHLFTSGRIDKVSNDDVQSKKQVNTSLHESRKFEEKFTGKRRGNSNFGYIHQRFAKKLSSAFNIHLSPLLSLFFSFNFILRVHEGIMEFIVRQDILQYITRIRLQLKTNDLITVKADTKATVGFADAIKSIASEEGFTDIAVGEDTYLNNEAQISFVLSDENEISEYSKKISLSLDEYLDKIIYKNEKIQSHKDDAELDYAIRRVGETGAIVDISEVTDSFVKDALAPVVAAHNEKVALKNELNVQVSTSQFNRKIGDITAEEALKPSERSSAYRTFEMFKRMVKEETGAEIVVTSDTGLLGGANVIARVVGKTVYVNGNVYNGSGASLLDVIIHMPHEVDHLLGASEANARRNDILIVMIWKEIARSTEKGLEGWKAGGLEEVELSAKNSLIELAKLMKLAAVDYELDMLVARAQYLLRDNPIALKTYGLGYMVNAPPEYLAEISHALEGTVLRPGAKTPIPAFKSGRITDDNIDANLVDSINVLIADLPNMAATSEANLDPAATLEAFNFRLNLRILKRVLGATRELFKETIVAAGSAGQCVTGDTLLPIVRSWKPEAGNFQPTTTSLRDTIQYSPIISVKPGDYVLSLNEKTNQIEPHRINALLDMGVKPVYKLTTDDGKHITTTANHPYLVRLDSRSSVIQPSNSTWLKVHELKTGDEIACLADRRTVMREINGGASPLLRSDGRYTSELAQNPETQILLITLAFFIASLFYWLDKNTAGKQNWPYNGQKNPQIERKLIEKITRKANSKNRFSKIGNYPCNEFSSCFVYNSHQWPIYHFAKEVSRFLREKEANDGRWSRVKGQGDVPFTIEPSPFTSNWRKVSELEPGDEIACFADRHGVINSAFFGRIKEKNEKRNDDNHCCQNVEENSSICHELTSHPHYDDISAYSYNPYDNIGNNQIIHNSTSFNIFMPSNKKIIENPVQIIKVGTVISPDTPGMKNPTTAEPSRSLDKSIKYSEIFSNCNLFNLNGIINPYLHYFAPGFVVSLKRIIEYSTCQENRIIPAIYTNEVEWDKIAFIEYAGEEHVYDIEVEGTHNFVAGHFIEKKLEVRSRKSKGKDIASGFRLPASNLFFGGIIAHNTYTDARSVDHPSNIPEVKPLFNKLRAVTRNNDPLIKPGVSPPAIASNNFDDKMAVIKAEYDKWLNMQADAANVDPNRTTDLSFDEKLLGFLDIATRIATGGAKTEENLLYNTAIKTVYVNGAGNDEALKEIFVRYQKELFDAYLRMKKAEASYEAHFQNGELGHALEAEYKLSLDSYDALKSRILDELNAIFFCPEVRLAGDETQEITYQNTKSYLDRPENRLDALAGLENQLNQGMVIVLGEQHGSKKAREIEKEISGLLESGDYICIEWPKDQENEINIILGEWPPPQADGRGREFLDYLQIKYKEISSSDTLYDCVLDLYVAYFLRRGWGNEEREGVNIYYRMLKEAKEMGVKIKCIDLETASSLRKREPAEELMEMNKHMAGEIAAVKETSSDSKIIAIIGAHHACNALTDLSDTISGGIINGVGKFLSIPAYTTILFDEYEAGLVEPPMPQSEFEKVILDGNYSGEKFMVNMIDSLGRPVKENGEEIFKNQKIFSFNGDKDDPFEVTFHDAADSVVWVGVDYHKRSKINSVNNERQDWSGIPDKSAVKSIATDFDKLKEYLLKLNSGIKKEDIKRISRVDVRMMNGTSVNTYKMDVTFNDGVGMARTKTIQICHGSAHKEVIDGLAEEYFKRPTYDQDIKLKELIKDYSSYLPAAGKIVKAGYATYEIFDTLENKLCIFELPSNFTEGLHDKINVLTDNFVVAEIKEGEDVTILGVSNCNGLILKGKKSGRDIYVIAHVSPDDNSDKIREICNYAVLPKESGELGIKVSEAVLSCNESYVDSKKNKEILKEITPNVAYFRRIGNFEESHILVNNSGVVEKRFIMETDFTFKEEYHYHFWERSSVATVNALSYIMNERGSVIPDGGLPQYSETVVCKLKSGVHAATVRLSQKEGKIAHKRLSIEEMLLKEKIVSFLVENKIEEKEAKFMAQSLCLYREAGLEAFVGYGVLTSKEKTAILNRDMDFDYTMLAKRLKALAVGYDTRITTGRTPETNRLKLVKVLFPIFEYDRLLRLGCRSSEIVENVEKWGVVKAISVLDNMQRILEATRKTHKLPDYAAKRIIICNGIETEQKAKIKFGQTEELIAKIKELGFSSYFAIACAIKLKNETALLLAKKITDAVNSPDGVMRELTTNLCEQIYIRHGYKKTISFLENGENVTAQLQAMGFTPREAMRLYTHCPGDIVTKLKSYEKKVDGVKKSLLKRMIEKGITRGQAFIILTKNISNPIERAQQTADAKKELLDAGYSNATANELLFFLNPDEAIAVKDDVKAKMDKIKEIGYEDSTSLIKFILKYKEQSVNKARDKRQTVDNIMALKNRDGRCDYFECDALAIVMTYEDNNEAVKYAKSMLFLVDGLIKYGFKCYDGHRASVVQFCLYRTIKEVRLLLMRLTEKRMKHTARLPAFILKRLDDIDSEFEEFDANSTFGTDYNDGQFIQKSRENINKMAKLIEIDSTGPSKKIDMPPLSDISDGYTPPVRAIADKIKSHSPFYLRGILNNPQKITILVDDNFRDNFNPESILVLSKLLSEDAVNVNILLTPDLRDEYISKLLNFVSVEQFGSYFTGSAVHALGILGASLDVTSERKREIVSLLVKQYSERINESSDVKIKAGSALVRLASTDDGLKADIAKKLGLKGRQLDIFQNFDTLAIDLDSAFQEFELEWLYEFISSIPADMQRIVRTISRSSVRTKFKFNEETGKLEWTGGIFDNDHDGKDIIICDSFTYPSLWGDVAMWRMSSTPDAIAHEYAHAVYELLTTKQKNIIDMYYCGFNTGKFNLQRLEINSNTMESSKEFYCTIFENYILDSVSVVNYARVIAARGGTNLLDMVNLIEKGMGEAEKTRIYLWTKEGLKWKEVGLPAGGVAAFPLDTHPFKVAGEIVPVSIEIPDNILCLLSNVLDWRNVIYDEITDDISGGAGIIATAKSEAYSNLIKLLDILKIKVEAATVDSIEDELNSLGVNANLIAELREFIGQRTLDDRLDDFANKFSSKIDKDAAGKLLRRLRIGSYILRLEQEEELIAKYDTTVIPLDMGLRKEIWQLANDYYFGEGIFAQNIGRFAATEKTPEDTTIFDALLASPETGKKDGSLAVREEILHDGNLVVKVRYSAEENEVFEIIVEGNGKTEILTGSIAKEYLSGLNSEINNDWKWKKLAEPLNFVDDKGNCVQETNYVIKNNKKAQERISLKRYSDLEIKSLLNAQVMKIFSEGIISEKHAKTLLWKVNYPDMTEQEIADKLGIQQKKVSLYLVGKYKAGMLDVIADYIEADKEFMNPVYNKDEEAGILISVLLNKTDMTLDDKMILLKAVKELAENKVLNKKQEKFIKDKIRYQTKKSYARIIEELGYAPTGYNSFVRELFQKIAVFMRDNHGYKEWFSGKYLQYEKEIWRGLFKRFVVTNRLSDKVKRYLCEDVCGSLLEEGDLSEKQVKWAVGRLNHTLATGSSNDNGCYEDNVKSGYEELAASLNRDYPLLSGYLETPHHWGVGLIISLKDEILAQTAVLYLEDALSAESAKTISLIAGQPSISSKELGLVMNLTEKGTSDRLLTTFKKGCVKRGAYSIFDAYMRNSCQIEYGTLLGDMTGTAEKNLLKLIVKKKGYLNSQAEQNFLKSVVDDMDRDGALNVGRFSEFAQVRRKILNCVVNGNINAAEIAFKIGKTITATKVYLNADANGTVFELAGKYLFERAGRCKTERDKEYAGYLKASLTAFKKELSELRLKDLIISNSLTRAERDWLKKYVREIDWTAAGGIGSVKTKTGLNISQADIFIDYIDRPDISVNQRALDLGLAPQIITDYMRGMNQTTAKDYDTISNVVGELSNLLNSRLLDIISKVSNVGIIELGDKIHRLPESKGKICLLKECSEELLTKSAIDLLDAGEINTADAATFILHIKNPSDSNVDLAKKIGVCEETVAFRIKKVRQALEKRNLTIADILKEKLLLSNEQSELRGSDRIAYNTAAVLLEGEYSYEDLLRIVSGVPKTEKLNLYSIESRHGATLEALNSEPRDEALDAIALVGLPEGLKCSVDLEDLKREIGRGLARAGHGDSADTHKVDFFFISQDKTKETEKSISGVLDRYKNKGRQIVLFKPENIGTEFKANMLTTVTDAYTDFDFSLKENFVDINSRIAIARLIGWYKCSKNQEGRIDAMKALREYLEKIMEGDIPKEKEDLNKLLNGLLLKIRPVDYKGDYTKWKITQKAFAASL